MPDNLTQNEIDEIVRQARANHLYNTGGKIVKNHDWLRPDKLKKEHFRVIRSLHDAFCKTVSLTLSQSLRGQIVVDVDPNEGIQQTSYSEYLMRAMSEVELTKPVWYTFSMSHGGSAQAALEIPRDFAYYVVDKIAGGKGQGSGAVIKEVGEIERDLLRRVVTHFLSDYAAAWDPRGNEDITAQIGRVETDPQFLSLTTSQNDVLLSIQLKITVMPKRSEGEPQPEEPTLYTLRLCLPYSLVEPILRDSVSRMPGQREDTAVSVEMKENLALVHVTLTALFGQTQLTVGDLMTLTPGDILVLDQSKDDPFVVLVNGSPLYLAGCGKLGTRKAIQIVGEWRARRYEN